MWLHRGEQRQLLSFQILVQKVQGIQDMGGGIDLSIEGEFKDKTSSLPLENKTILKKI